MRSSRRSVLRALAAFSVFPQAAFSKTITDLRWTDLLPIGQTAIPPALQALLQHDQMALAARQPASSGVRFDWNGKQVRLPGYVVPMTYSGAGITSFILVPFVGACVHVPPPPANQLVFVTVKKPFKSKGLFEAVNVEGTFSASSTYTELGDIGYSLSADRVEKFSI